MKKKLLLIFLGTFLLLGHAIAQQITVTGKVLDEDRNPLPGASINIKGLQISTSSGSDGVYRIKASMGQTITFRYLGCITQEIEVGTTNVIDVILKNDVSQLSEIQVVGALGIKASKRELGYATQKVEGSEVAQTQRENFINGLQGRVAGVDVVTTSGVPGASSQIFIRGISSVSSNNQPLFVIDGVPLDNSSNSSDDFAGKGSMGNQTVDFTNRAADINPEDIEDFTILKGPEAAALYGIDAANGAILITTKRGKPGEGRINYNNSIRIDRVTKAPEIQTVYGEGRNGVPSGGYTINYFGPKYDGNEVLYDNISSFFETSITQKHNLSFEGGNDKSTYRVSGNYNGQDGVVPNTSVSSLSLAASNTTQIKPWVKLDAAMTYSNSDVKGVFKGEGGPLLNLLVWPATDDAKNYINVDGGRRTLNFDGETENPYFNVNKNWTRQKNSRIVTAVGLNFTIAKWLNFDTKLGYDTYTNSNDVLRHPESNYGKSYGGLYDESTTNVKNLTLRGTFMGNIKNILPKINFKFNAGMETRSDYRKTVSLQIEKFLDPNFVSINNASLASRYGKTSTTQRRLMGAYGSFTFDYDRLVYLTVTGRNDWSSTLPVANQSFFYPSASLAFNFTDLSLFKDIKGIISNGKLRASIAQVGRDAAPYRVYPSLEFKETIGGGFGYGNYGPNPRLVPEMATSHEIGAEFSVLKDRLSFDLAYYSKKTEDQIIGGIRSSYGTGFILSSLNGGSTKNWGYEAMITGRPIVGKKFTWTVVGNFAASRSKLLKLPKDLPESYNSDTWYYGDIRSASIPGLPITSFTSRFTERNNNGDILINPTTGLPTISAEYIPNGSDRWPDWTLGITNKFSYKGFSLNFLLDIRRGGDVLNLTQYYLTRRGLATTTLDRERPRIIKGILKDGLQNSANPTQNNVTIIPYLADSYYILGVQPEMFIEKDVNYIRMRDLTLSYSFSSKLLARQKILRSARIFTTITDLFLITNYTGLDPVSNGNNAAVGGAGGIGMDYGNFSNPTGFNIGLNIGF